MGIKISQAQVFSCSSLCIQSISIDTANNELDVTVINAGTEQVNYPVIVVVDTAGDTIANINADFYLFAQLGNDTVTHDLPTTLDSLPSNFTGTVYVTDAIYDTTCSYSYPMNWLIRNILMNEITVHAATPVGPKTKAHTLRVKAAQKAAEQELEQYEN